MTNLRDRMEVRAEPQSDPVADWLRSWVDAWGTGLGSGRLAVLEQSTASFNDALASVPAQACLIGIEAWLRYSGAVAEAFVQYEMKLRQAMVEPAQEGSGVSLLESRLVVDEARALLRRVGDAATLEARRAQDELEKLGEWIACAAAAVECAPLHPDRRVRRHEVKV